MDEIIIKYKAEIDGYKAELEDLKKADKNTRAVVEKPIEVTANTKSLRAQLREAQAEVATLSEKFGATSKEAAMAAKRAAELKDAIGDAKALTDAFNPDAKFAALSSSIGGVVGGFQAYEGALALVGSESEDLQKTLVKLQALMALSQGVQQLGEARDSFKQLAAVVKDQVKTAFTTLRGAMTALGIGALVIAIGLIVANWQDLVKWIDKTFPGLKKVTDFFRNFQQVSAGALNAVVNGFKGAGAVISKFFAGDFSGAYKDAKKIGSNMANAYNEGYAQKDAEMKRAQAFKDRDFAIRLAEAQGKDMKKTRLQLLRDELKDLEANSEAARDKQIEIAQLITDIKKAALDKQEADRKLAEEKEKTDNEKVLKNRDDALRKISDLEIRNQKELIAELEAQGAPKLKIEEEKIKLLEAEQKYNNQILAINSSFANQLKDKYTDTKQKELDAVVQGNKKILEEEAKIRNERIKLEIQQAISSPDLQTAKLESLKKQLQLETGLTLEEANKRKIELLKIDEDIILSKMQNNDREIQALLQAEASYDGELVQSRLKSNEDLNQKLIEGNRARIAEEEKQEKEAAEKRKQMLQKNIDELFAFASSGILLQIGLDPQALAKVKSDIETAIKTFKNPDASDWQKASAVATAATSTVMAAVDTLSANEKAASEQRIAQLNTEKEAELAAAGENEEKKALIRQKYEQKIKAEKRKQFEADKRASILRVIMTTAEAVIKAVALNPAMGGLPFSAIAAAIGAAQIALIASQPTPKFKDGVVGFNGVVGGVGTGTSDSNLAWLSKGESVIPAQATGQNLGLVTSLVNGDVDKYIKSHYILPAIEQKEAEVIQTSQKRIDDIENKLINRTISRTLEAMRKDNKVNTAEIVTAIKKDKFTL